jgi:4-hydroxybenzoate polyprenyltransferase
LLTTAFAAFCCAASAGYIANDVLDASVDRQHPEKRHRPFASGELTRGFGATLAFTLLTFAVVLASRVSMTFALIIVGYVLLSLAYSAFLKTLPLLDVFLLALFYVIRLFSGGIAANVVISPWLAAFAVFFFLNLAFLKRYTEIRQHGIDKSARRGYQDGDDILILGYGTTSGFLSVLILALYMSTERAFSLYHRPQFLWAICFCILYWVARSWLIAHRDRMNDDPVVFVLHDRTSYVIALVCSVFLALAI